MDQDKPGLNQQFNVSAIGDAEQKRQQAIASTRDQEQREKLEALRKERDEKIAQAREKAKQQEERIVKEKLDERERAKQQLNLTPKGAVPSTRKQLEKQVRSDVRQTLGAQLDTQLDHYERQLNQKLDRAIDAARERERERPPRSLWKTNAQDMTKPERERQSGLWKSGPTQQASPGEAQPSAPELDRKGGLSREWQHSAPERERER